MPTQRYGVHEWMFFSWYWIARPVLDTMALNGLLLFVSILVSCWIMWLYSYSTTWLVEAAQTFFIFNKSHPVSLKSLHVPTELPLRGYIRSRTNKNLFSSLFHPCLYLPMEYGLSSAVTKNCVNLALSQLSYSKIWYDTIQYIYVHSQADEMASLI